MELRKVAGMTVLLGTLAPFGTAAAASAEMPQGDMLATLSALHQHQAELAELAQERAERTEIGGLAATLREDHAVLDDWAMAATEGNEPTSAASLSDEKAHESLQSLEGAEFDTAFLRYQETLHREALDLLEQNRPADGELSEYANHLKVTHEALRKHVALIQGEREQGQ